MKSILDYISDYFIGFKGEKIYAGDTVASLGNQFYWYKIAKIEDGIIHYNAVSKVDNCMGMKLTKSKNQRNYFVSFELYSEKKSELLEEYKEVT